MQNLVTLETKCWEGDWKLLLKTNRLQLLAERNSLPFAEKVLMINNVKDYTAAGRYAKLAIDRGWITKYIVVEDHADEALVFFGLSRKELGRAYVYSVAELVSIYLCSTKFLLHFSSDSIPASKYEWIPQAIDLFNSDPRVKVSNLTWDFKFREAKAESFEESQDFYIGYGFSDQCYLIRTEDFRARIYHEYHPASQRYPAHGGELFEKRVDSWMRNNRYLRATFKHGTYSHKARPQPCLVRSRIFAGGIYRKLRALMWAHNSNGRPWC